MAPNFTTQDSMLFMRPDEASPLDLTQRSKKMSMDPNVKVSRTHVLPQRLPEEKQRRVKLRDKNESEIRNRKFAIARRCIDSKKCPKDQQQAAATLFSLMTYGQFFQNKSDDDLLTENFDKFMKNKEGNKQKDFCYNSQVSFSATPTDSGCESSDGEEYDDQQESSRKFMRRSDSHESDLDRLDKQSSVDSASYDSGFETSDQDSSKQSDDESEFNSSQKNDLEASQPSEFDASQQTELKQENVLKETKLNASQEIELNASQEIELNALKPLNKVEDNISLAIEAKSNFNAPPQRIDGETKNESEVSQLSEKDNKVVVVAEEEQFTTQIESLEIKKEPTSPLPEIPPPNTIKSEVKANIASLLNLEVFRDSECYAQASKVIHLFAFLVKKNMIGSFLKTFSHSMTCRIKECSYICTMFKGVFVHVTTSPHGPKCAVKNVYSHVLRIHLDTCQSQNCGLPTCQELKNKRRSSMLQINNSSSEQI